MVDFLIEHPEVVKTSLGILYVFVAVITTTVMYRFNGGLDWGDIFVGIIWLPILILIAFFWPAIKLGNKIADVLKIGK